MSVPGMNVYTENSDLMRYAIFQGWLNKELLLTDGREA